VCTQPVLPTREEEPTMIDELKKDLKEIATDMELLRSHL
jgi:hypothetical protein